MSTPITADPFRGLRFFEDEVTRLMSNPVPAGHGRPLSTFSKPKMPAP
jgi:hypothetical protein